MSEFILNVKPYLECASFIGTIALSIFALYGLKQIRLLKIDMLNRSERSAKEKAIEAINSYFSEAIPAYNKYSALVRQKGLKFYDGSIKEFKTEELKNNKAAFDNGIARIGLFVWAESFNRMEAIAAAFVTGVADEETGFKVIGRLFVDTIISNYDILTLVQSEASKGKHYFPNTIELFKVWHPRFTAKELELERSSIEQRLQNLGSHTVQSLKPNC